MLTLDPIFTLAIISLFIPVVTGLLTKSSASATIKQVATIVLAAANALFVSNQHEGGAVISRETGLLWLVSTGIAVTTYLGIYKPHDLNEKTSVTDGVALG